METLACLEKGSRGGDGDSSRFAIVGNVTALAELRVLGRRIGARVRDESAAGAGAGA